jgi:hypothetical protein
MRLALIWGMRYVFPFDCLVRKCANEFLQLGETPSGLQKDKVAEGRVAQAVGAAGNDPEDDDLQARLDSLRR